METIKKENKTDLKNFVNIRQFTLAPGVQENGPEVKAIRKYIKSKDYSEIESYIESGRIIEMTEEHNIIVDTGLEEQAKSQSGERATSPSINYGILCVSPSPTPGATSVIGDITEGFRKLASSRSHDKNVSYIDFFFAAADCSGTYTRFANVIDGTASANSGILFSYIANSPSWVKTTAQSLFISCEYHNNNA
ncbi:hypothetical protein CVU83_01900 [Candidatus Falkowbacteria bacterium HGW-Falkowbacteria-2]|uniref:Uncharacterized protein n=1 Tax=Candidatus Falkowbacteria bacterium HGW-Falkowbacteria-2 TaxID=2013769 RepID=A0A2N2E0R6_9BACT|nr:MAG: hypothetical protein CVU83_01900 [Candidatus Falkowbacteria bacterium HGW-Falkowbacteria-2]